MMIENTAHAAIASGQHRDYRFFISVGAFTTSSLNFSSQYAKSKKQAFHTHTLLASARIDAYAYLGLILR